MSSSQSADKGASAHIQGHSPNVDPTKTASKQSLKDCNGLTTWQQCMIDAQERMLEDQRVMMTMLQRILEQQEEILSVLERHERLERNSSLTSLASDSGSGSDDESMADNK
ncbi:hypothetical protein PFICI_09539 [Pestalotiopsis fici W106-1]|uniref:Uncharacterized protein n=1 Tax=Pestalotiopsis fici (strain W106-1 / CGMCC3.15140) TaxID=1229662 RepID=W3X3G7_PESFW|nr:uncharacterized protein PFICI_09539 [Pestalotiopsis fici W106-1]ETS79686.1 hypothetical protein PFICI_09539 [Pestalotiopsis fici W106-1]